LHEKRLALLVFLPEKEMASILSLPRNPPSQVTLYASKKVVPETSKGDSQGERGNQLCLGRRLLSVRKCHTRDFDGQSLFTLPKDVSTATKKGTEREQSVLLFLYNFFSKRPRFLLPIKVMI
jgi:hypothetical protein